MKVNFYYVVKVHQPGTDSIDRSADAEYVSGPFRTDGEGRDYIKDNFILQSDRMIHTVVHINTKVSL